MADVLTITNNAAPTTVTLTGAGGFRRVAGIAGIVSVAVGATTFPMMGTVPTRGSSAADVAAYYGSNSGAHRTAVVVTALLAIPIAVFFVGVHRAISSASNALSAVLGTIFLYGAIMMSATAGVREGFYAIAVAGGDAGLAPALVK